MKVFDAKLKDVKIIEPDVFEDERGFFSESYSEDKYKKLGDSLWYCTQKIGQNIKLFLFSVLNFKVSKFYYF